MGAGRRGDPIVRGGPALAGGWNSRRGGGRRACPQAFSPRRVPLPRRGQFPAGIDRGHCAGSRGASWASASMSPTCFTAPAAALAATSAPIPIASNFAWAAWARVGRASFNPLDRAAGPLDVLSARHIDGLRRCDPRFWLPGG